MSIIEISNEIKQIMLQKAIEATKSSYCPYSNYPVGACLLMHRESADEEPVFYTGSNVENASFGLTVCAETCAFVKAFSEGHRKIDACLCVTKDGGTCCGRCRQMLREGGMGAKMIIINAKISGEIVSIKTLDEILPQSFGPENLLSNSVLKANGLL